MSPRSRARLAALLLLGSAPAACNEDVVPTTSLPPARRITIEFTYLAPTTTNPAVARQFASCVDGVGRTHIHPSWMSFNRIDMTAVDAGRWAISFENVVAERSHSIRISDPNACATDPNGASTEQVYANGVLLTRVVSTPGNGPEPGLAFSISADGKIVP